MVALISSDIFFTARFPGWCEARCTAAAPRIPLAKSRGSLDQMSSESGAIWQLEAPAVLEGVPKMAGRLHMVVLSVDAMNGNHGGAIKGARGTHGRQSAQPSSGENLDCRWHWIWDTWRLA